jgi:hypothetical protein
MARHVFPSDEIPHLWAHRTQKEARNPQGNSRFIGDVIYSYAEPIGRLIVHRGRTIALFRDESWSVTTSRHQSAMRGAAHHLKSFTVASIGTERYRDGQLGKPDHRANLKDFAAKIKAAGLAAVRARGHKEWKVRHMLATVETANDYAATFGLGTRFAVPSDIDLAKLEADAREQTRRDAERAKRVERKRELAEQQARHDEAARLQRWLAGSNEGRYFRYLDSAYLRVAGDVVETTQGARVPLGHVQRALPIIGRLIERGEAYQRNGHTIHLGPYVLDSIAADGTVTAGCHTFKPDEVRRFLGVLATLPPAPKPQPEAATA